jgi:hypothetical protein
LSFQNYLHSITILIPLQEKEKKSIAQRNFFAFFFYLNNKVIGSPYKLKKKCFFKESFSLFFFFSGSKTIQLPNSPIRGGVKSGASFFSGGVVHACGEGTIDLQHDLFSFLLTLKFVSTPPKKNNCVLRFVFLSILTFIFFIIICFAFDVYEF